MDLTIIDNIAKGALLILLSPLVILTVGLIGFMLIGGFISAFLCADMPDPKHRKIGITINIIFTLAIGWLMYRGK